ncbi:hypothetical protein U1Q18_026903 [Sarracenia purpurea var. burkii]
MILDTAVSFRRLSRHQRQNSLPECHSSVCFQRPNRCKALPVDDDANSLRISQICANSLPSLFQNRLRNIQFGAEPLLAFCRARLPICRSPDPRSGSMVDLPTSGRDFRVYLCFWDYEGIVAGVLLHFADLANAQAARSNEGERVRELGCWDLDVGSTASESVLTGCISALEASLHDDEGGVG